ncbi:energy-coupling factor ABC transporter ATP-binding protein [Brevibacterium samyangense]|uniref:Energy-coupling factor ABC transporter ATP-binding protein n=1 Tax=Brevibacterium samyangense TaxID=366888 RepID=A0ABP5EP41_9MICO
MIRFEGASVVVEEFVETPGGPRTAPALVPRTILHPIDLSLDGPFTSVIGANGSGKSTLLTLVNGLTRPSAGRVLVDGIDTVREGAAVRRNVGFVFTDPAAQLVMPTPLEDVELSLRRAVKDSSERTARAHAVLAELAVDHLAQRSVTELSGGERQLVALAAVLAVDPQVLVLDEPTTLLDLRNRELLRRTLRTLVDTRGLRILLTTHDLDVAQDAARTLLVDDGRIVADGDPAEVVAEYRQQAGVV